MDHSAPVFFALLIGVFAACAPLQNGNSKTIRIATVNGRPSQVQGQAQWSTRGDGTTRIRVALTGLQPGSKHAGRIQVGSCDNGGPVMIVLSEVVADANGNGSSEQILETSRIPVAASIRFDQASADGVACGDLR